MFKKGVNVELCDTTIICTGIELRSMSLTVHAMDATLLLKHEERLTHLCKGDREEAVTISGCRTEQSWAAY
jgi:hypothetical protein